MIQDRTLRRSAGGLFAVCATLTLGTVAFGAVAVARHVAPGKSVDFFSGFIFLIDGLVFAAVGTLIVRRQPRNTIGWLLLAVGALWAVGLTLSVYADYGVNVQPGSVPAPALANALVVWTWVPAVGMMAIFIVLLFPDGHLPSPRWRWLARLSAGVMIVLSVGFMTDPHAFSDSSLEKVANPLAVQFPDWVRSVVEGIFVLFPLCMLAAAVAAIGRYRRSTGVERQQMKWLVTAGAFFASFFGLILLLGTLPAIHDNKTLTDSVNFFFPVTFVFFPLAIGAAVLRYHLYDIDVVISRSLVFGALATFITVVYVTVVVGIGRLVGAGDRPDLALSVAATALVAVAFEPVRDRLQRVANRLVYGERATPYEVLSTFADRVGGAYDATELLPVMARTVAQGVDADKAQVWLRREDGFVLAATWPVSPEGPWAPRTLEEVEGDRVTPVSDRGDLLGAVAVTNRSGRELTPVEDRLLDTLATQAGPVLRNVRLIADLRTSRQRLVATQDEERRRLERNLHDGAQQSLVAVALMMRLVQSRVAVENARVGATLDQAAQELGMAIEELRELARGIYPAVLAESGLGAALTSLAERSPVPVVVEDRLDRRLSPGVERALYFVAAEVIPGCARVRAGEVLLRLELTTELVTLLIDDDGPTGDDPARRLARQRLLDRTAVVDGTLTLSDGAATGLHLTCAIPLPGDQPTQRVDHTAPTAVPQGAGQ